MKLSGLVPILLLSLALAGCLGDDSTAELADAEDAQSQEDAAVDASAADESTADQEPRNNTAPEANLTADRLEGEAPLTVNFTLEGNDADGDNMTWELDLDGDLEADLEGTTLPDTANHTFEAGNHTVTLTVDDGQNRTSTNVTISATAPPPPEEPADEVEDDGLCHAGDEATAIPPVEGSEVLYVVGTWLYEESNGVPGLQYTEEPSAAGEVDPKGVGCTGGDTVII